MIKRIFTICLCFLLLAMQLCGCASENLRAVRVAYACQTELSESSPDSAIGYVTHRIVDVPGERMYLLTLQLALYDPDTEGLVSPFPEGVLLRSVEVDDEGIAHVVYSDAYAALDGMSKTLADFCTLFTLCQFDEIIGVKISSESADDPGEVLLYADYALTELENLRLMNYDVTLYFLDPLTNDLVAVEETLTLAESESLERKIVESLILGHRHDTGFRRHISQYTECLSIEVRSRTCYVDLNEHFYDLNMLNDDGISLTVYSIVNSLCQLDEVDNVQFLINGEPVADVMTQNFDKPLEPNYSLVVTE